MNNESEIQELPFVMVLGQSNGTKYLNFTIRFINHLFQWYKIHGVALVNKFWTRNIKK